MTKILLGAPVRQKPHIFREYLRSLDRLEIPDGVEVRREFMLHGCPELAEMLRPEDMFCFRRAEDSYDTEGDTHRWQQSNFTAVAEMKNDLLRQAREGGYDYFFLVDSDLILHPQTLARLLGRQKDVTAEIFWTKWSRDGNAIGPNCWDLDFCGYGPDGVQRYLQPGLHRTGGTGACILISRAVLLDENVSYTPIYNLSFSRWEDRAFCVRAAANGFELWIDTTCPALHLYRQEDYDAYMEGRRA